MIGDDMARLHHDESISIAALKNAPTRRSTLWKARSSRQAAMQRRQAAARTGQGTASITSARHEFGDVGEAPAHHRARSARSRSVTSSRAKPWRLRKVFSGKIMGMSFAEAPSEQRSVRTE